MLYVCHMWHQLLPVHLKQPLSTQKSLFDNQRACQIQTVGSEGKEIKTIV